MYLTFQIFLRNVSSTGVGDDIDYTELSEIASKHEFMFEVSGSSALKEIKEIIAGKTCQSM